MSFGEICEKYGIEVTREERERIEQYTMRKCMVNGEGEDYYPLLLKDEILSYAVRRCINGIGR